MSGSDLFSEINYSTFGVALSAGDVAVAVDAAEAVAASAGFDVELAPVCVIGTTLSESCWMDLRDAVMVSTPSDDNVDCTSLGLVFAMNKGNDIDQKKQFTWFIMPHQMMKKIK